MRKYLYSLVLSGMMLSLHAQQTSWQHQDLYSTGIFGVSSNRAYVELLKGKKAKEVIVAVIDGGVDTNHTDLKPVLGVKGKYGWSYLGSSKGNIHHETQELTRLIRTGQQRFPNPEQPPVDTSGLADYLKIRSIYRKKLSQLGRQISSVESYKLIADTIFAGIGKSDPDIIDLKRYVPETLLQNSIKGIMIGELNGDSTLTIQGLRKGLAFNLEHMMAERDYALNLNYDPRGLVGDQMDNLKQNKYGSHDVMGPDASHGSHVSGIIGAVRNNGIGIDGIADYVKILNIRAVPDGDERDKDVANAIIYAADHGAKIINMSFGKPYSPNKPRVDDAVKYAMSKDVLLVHAAGNNGLDLDNEVDYFPNKIYADGSGLAKAWLNVGANGPKDNQQLVASFSNFGKTKVDVFAPGVGIYSTVPGSEYRLMDGTSMAAPVVSGIAALIRSYYPKLTAIQVKEIIMKSVIKVDHDVLVVKKGRRINIPFADVCVSGGVANAFQALKLAASY